MVTLRAATEADKEIVWRINNDPEARAQSRSTAEIPWADHAAWFARALHGALWIIEVNGAIAGVVRVNEGVISIALTKEHRGHGIGTQAITLACERCEGPVDAWILERNRASERAFTKAGFDLRGHVVERGRKFFVWRWTRP
jgi:RimJ/RimL family protein N-acetyltransferase